MKNSITILFLLIGNSFFAQIKITSEILSKLKAGVEIEAQKKKNDTINNFMSSVESDYEIELYKIVLLNQKIVETDDSTESINIAILESINSFEILMNKYYEKLLLILNQEEKKILIDSQNSWQIYYENELKLLELNHKKEFPHGSIILPNKINSRKSNLIELRTDVLFNHYNEIIN